MDSVCPVCKTDFVYRVRALQHLRRYSDSACTCKTEVLTARFAVHSPEGSAADVLDTFRFFFILFIFFVF